MNEKNIRFKNRPPKSKKDIVRKNLKIRDLISNISDLITYIIHVFILLGLGYLIFIKVIPTIYYETFQKYNIKERIELVNVNKILFNKDEVENADIYYETLTNYDAQKNSKNMLQLKSDIINDTYVSFKLEEINYSKSMWYSDNKISKIEYSKDVKQPKIKLIYEDKYYETNKEGKKGQLAKKEKLPKQETTLVLPKENNE